MPLLGQAALAMWWNMAAGQRAEFQHWHSHEHFPERLGIPGFARASRWASAEDNEGFFVLYELAGFEVLTSPAYLERLNNPTPWSIKMMPHHRDMVRSQTRVLESVGSLLGGSLATIRLSPQPGREQALQADLRAQLRDLAGQAGLNGGHLLRTQTPAIEQTREQQIRGGDKTADWIVLVSGSDEGAVQEAAHAMLSVDAAPGMTISRFRLAHSMTPADL